MTDTAEMRAPETPADDGHRTALLAALRVARARAALVLFNIDEIGTELKEERLTPKEAMRMCLAMRIDSLFPRESDGA